MGFGISFFMFKSLTKVKRFMYRVELKEKISGIGLLLRSLNYGQILRLKINQFYVLFISKKKLPKLSHLPSEINRMRFAILIYFSIFVDFVLQMVSADRGISSFFRIIIICFFLFVIHICLSSKQYSQIGRSFE